MIEIGKRYLITTDNWFYAPDGKSYTAVYGTVNAIKEDDALGIKTNRHSSNWYLEIGNMVIAGCQIHYACRTDSCELESVEHDEWGRGKAHRYTRGPAIYNADTQEDQGIEDE